MGQTGENTFLFREQLSNIARERLGVSQIAEMISLVVENGALSFGAGEPSVDLFPKEPMRAAMKEAFAGDDIWGYYHEDFGDEGLRGWIATRMRIDDILPDWVGANDILLTNGGGEAVSLVTEALVDAGSVVLVESPTYTETLLTFRKQGAVCVPVPSDDEGIIPEELERVASAQRARFLYTIPNFQNPSGRTTPLARRERILGILRRHDMALLEDDPYHYLSYDGVPPTSYLRLAGEDRRVIHVNSFSKIVAPGLRTGWAVIPPALRDVFTSLRISAGLGRPLAIQRGIHEYLRGIDFEKRIGELCDEYRRRRAVMLEMIEKYLTPLGIRSNRPAGGFFIWAEAPQSMPNTPNFDAACFSRYAVARHQIGIIPGSAFYPGGDDGGRRAFRLSFAKVPTDQVEEGMRRLYDAWNSYKD